MINLLNTGLEVLNTVDIQGISNTLDMMNLTQLTMVADKVVELHNSASGFPGFDLNTETVMPYLTTMSSNAASIRAFLNQTLHSFIPFINGGALFLATFKASAAIFKTLLGRFKEAVEDVKWVMIGLCILAVLPTAIEAVEAMLFEGM